jgi:hypothetical protein
VASSIGSLLAWVAYFVPFAAVAVVGTAVALARWRRHPRVSAIVAGTLVAFLALAVLYQIGVRLVYAQMGPLSTNSPDPRLVVYLGLLGLIYTVVRVGAWAAMFVAAFSGRRTMADGGRWQFSIRGLLLLTLFVGVTCGLLRGLLALFELGAGILILWIDDVPMLICWLIGARLAIIGRKHHPAVSTLVLAAIGASFSMLAINQFPWLWIMLYDRAAAVDFTPLVSLMTALVGAAAWAMLTAAALGWREPTEPAVDPATAEPASTTAQPAAE